MKKVSLAALLTFLLLLSIVAVGWAASNPSELVIVRASDDSLWKATCIASSCTGFTKFPGLFASQPTVVWDEVLSQYVVWGRASNSTIWRSTFSSDGIFNNDWVSIPGLTSSPLAAAGSNFKYPWGNWANKGSIAVNTITTDCANMQTLTSISVTPPANSYQILAFTDGIYAPGLAAKFVRVCLSTVPGGACGTAATDSWGPVLEADTVGSYLGERRYALNLRVGPISANTTYNIYLKACAETGAIGTLYWDRLVSTTTQ